MEHLITIIILIGMVGVVSLIIFLLIKEKSKVKDKDKKTYIDMYGANLSTLEKEVFTLINNYRITLGLQPLISNAFTSNVICEPHVEYCIKLGYASHNNFPQRYNKIKDNIPAERISEIVSSGFHNPDGVVNGFRNSTDHNKSLVGDYTHMGISVKSDRNGKLYTCIINLKVK